MKLQDQVYRVLQRRPEARDNDNYLCWLIWYNYNKECMIDMETFRERFIANKIPSADSITRCRRKIQEAHLELRGTKYEIRQKNQKKVKQDLGYGKY